MRITQLHEHYSLSKYLIRVSFIEMRKLRVRTAQGHKAGRGYERLEVSPAEERLPGSPGGAVGSRELGAVFSKDCLSEQGALGQTLWGASIPDQDALPPEGCTLNPGTGLGKRNKG